VGNWWWGIVPRGTYFFARLTPKYGWVVFEIEEFLRAEGDMARIWLGYTQDRDRIGVYAILDEPYMGGGK